MFLSRKGYGFLLWDEGCVETGHLKPKDVTSTGAGQWDGVKSCLDGG